MRYSASLMRYLFTGLLGIAWPTVFAAAAGEEGKALYTAYGCYQCHGYDGQGAITGPRLAPRPLPYEAFRQFVRYPVNRMPPYPPGELSETELKQMYRYLESIGEPPEIGDIPSLSERKKEVSG